MKSKPDWKIMAQGAGAIILTVLVILLLTYPRLGFPVLDNVNLLIHEAGHIFFATLGQFMGMLGGTIMQIIIPLGIAVYFKFTKQIMGLSFALFWLGESLINVSIYIKDARFMLLPLVNGGIHDWNWILKELHLLTYDQTLGSMVFFAGAIIALTGPILAIYTFLKNTGHVISQNPAK